MTNEDSGDFLTLNRNPFVEVELHDQGIFVQDLDQIRVFFTNEELFELNKILSDRPKNLG